MPSVETPRPDGRGKLAGRTAPGTERPWRAGLVALLVRATFVVMTLGLLVAHFLIQPAPIRQTVEVATGVFVVALAIELWDPSLGTRGRSKLLVANYLVTSVVTLVLGGPLAGPMMLACATVVLSRVLLGRGVARAMTAILSLVVVVYGVTIFTGQRPWGRRALAEVTSGPGAWARTTVIAVLLIAVIGLLVSHVVDRLEGVIDENVRLYEEAREAVRLRDEFLRIASHELQTPLAALTLASDRIVRRRPVTPEQIERSAGVVQRNVARLSELVGQFLDVARIEMGPMELAREEVDLGEVVREVVNGTDAEITLDLSPDVVGRWDRHRIEQVVGNLVTNAVRFGAGRPVEVGLRRVGDRARLVVRDHGPGLAPEVIPHIFDRFFRLDAVTASGGLGLGLFIVREIVEALGGTIRAESAEDGGARFVVELPVEAPPPEREVEVEIVPRRPGMEGSESRVT